VAAEPPARAMPASSPRRRVRVLIVWWSMTGGTRQLAEAAAAGARAVADAHVAGEGHPIEVELVEAPRAGPEHVLAADALVFATPENLASMAGMMKDFFDRTYYAVLGRVEGRPYASIVCAGSDGQGAARQIDRIATGWRLRRVADPLVVITNAQTPQAILATKRIDGADLTRAHELGSAMAAGVSLGVW